MRQATFLLTALLCEEPSEELTDGNITLACRMGGVWDSSGIKMQAEAINKHCAGCSRRRALQGCTFTGSMCSHQLLTPACAASLSQKHGAAMDRGALELAVTGKALDVLLRSERMGRLLFSTRIFARCTPEQKARRGCFPAVTAHAAALEHAGSPGACQQCTQLRRRCAQCITLHQLDAAAMLHRPNQMRKPFVACRSWWRTCTAAGAW